MVFMKRHKPGPFDRLWRTVTSIDMFGETVRLNMDGKERFNTCCGALCTLMVLAATAAYCLFFIRLYDSQKSDEIIPILSTYVKQGYFEEDVEIRQDTDDFYFAVAITGRHAFTSHTAEAFEAAGGKLNLRFAIFGGEEDGQVRQLQMDRCSDMSFYKPSGVETKDRVAKAHLDID